MHAPAMWRLSIASLTLLIPVSLAQCPVYTLYSAQRHEPLSTGRHQLSYQRPIEPCRTFFSQEVEDTIARLKGVIADPDLFRLFENSWPSTLDTTIAWHGYANTTDEDSEKEELTFVITGDIEAMWLRDSANQLLAYTSVLKPNSSFNSLASLFRGAINLQARYILEDPFCNAFQAPPESGVVPKSSRNSDQITPPYDYFKVFSCQWELDSVASFLQLSAAYMAATNDLSFFQKSSNWTRAVSTILHTAQSMTLGSYAPDGTWLKPPYTYCAPYGGTPINECTGSPHRGQIGLIRSFHRPSDDACIYQYLIPSNMAFSAALNVSSNIMARVEPAGGNLTSWMRSMATGINRGIVEHAIVSDARYGKIYAYEIDGYGSHIAMDDPNVPSLLSAPWLTYTTNRDPVYRNTRAKILSRDNPYFAWGPIISGVGSMHTLPGKVWPMANVMAMLTSDDDEEIAENLGMVLRSTAGTGLVHESVDAHAEGVYSRSWFSWANGLLGQAVLEVDAKRPWVLEREYQ
jgi:meiotically up-regulated gene 157 (Mug157) protein